MGAEALADRHSRALSDHFSRRIPLGATVPPSAKLDRETTAGTRSRAGEIPGPGSVVLGHRLRLTGPIPVNPGRYERAQRIEHLGSGCRR